MDRISSKFSEGLPGSMNSFLGLVLGWSGLRMDMLSELLTLNERVVTF